MRRQMGMEEIVSANGGVETVPKCEYDDFVVISPSSKFA
jgi:hypothetical protein